MVLAAEADGTGKCEARRREESRADVVDGWKRPDREKSDEKSKREMKLRFVLGLSEVGCCWKVSG
jgi:hypothetical protein